MKTMTIHSDLSPIKGKQVPAKAFKAFFSTHQGHPDWITKADLARAHFRAACHFFPGDRDSHKTFLTQVLATSNAPLS